MNGKGLLPRQIIMSLAQKEGAVPVARGLVERNCNIISTGNTAKYLQEHGISVTDISEITGLTDEFHGRVKTLHPAVFAGILYDGTWEYEKAMRQQGFSTIHMVIVNFYPFKEVANKRGATLEEALKNIDIGGPAMVRAAAKNYERTLPIVDLADMERVFTELDKDGEVSSQFRFYLATKAFQVVREYDQAISDFFTLIS